MKASVLRSKMTLKEKALWRVWRGKAARISDEVLNEDVKKVEGVYQDAGYVYAKVAEVRREPVGDDYVDLTFVVVEGESMTLATSPWKASPSSPPKSFVPPCALSPALPMLAATSPPMKRWLATTTAPAVMPTLAWTPALFPPVPAR